MLILPLYGLCAIALTGVLFPWMKTLQEPSIALLYSASAISRDCFKEFGDWLQLSTEDVGRVVSRPLSSLPLIVYLPTPSSSSSSSNIWNGTKEYILLPSDSSLATVTQLEKSLSLVTPFKVHPPPHPMFGSGSAVNNDAGAIFEENELIISNEGLPLFLGLVFAILVAFHLVVYVFWKRELAKFDRQAEEGKVMASKLMEDLSRAKIVLDKTEAKDSYLKGVLDGLETIKQSETSSSSSSSNSNSSEAHIKILEHLYKEDSSPTPTLFSVKRWTMSSSEFESTYGTVLRVPSAESSSVVPQFSVERPSQRTKPNSDIGNDVKRPVIANNAHLAPRQSDNGGRPMTIQGTDRISTVVPNLHVERLSVPSVPVTEIVEPSAMVDIHAGDPSDTDTNTSVRRRENVTSPSTTVDIRVEGASDRDLVGERIEQQASISPEPVVPPVPVTEIVEPSAMIDPVAKVTSAGGNNPPDTSTVESGRDNGYDSSTSVHTAILAPATATAPATAGVEVQRSPPTDAPQTEQPSARRRKNRMGQRQRRRLREMRENRGWEEIQLTPQPLQIWVDE